MRRLIIGCGYLGKRVADRWRMQGDEVFALTRSPERAAKWHSEGLRAIVGDVLEPATLGNLPNADVCLYSVGYDRSAGADRKTVMVGGLNHLLGALPSKCGRLIYVSSTSVYEQHRGETVTESSPCRPASERGKVCLQAEQLVRRFAETDGQFSAVILRLAGIYGPGRLIARRDQLLSGTPLTVNPQAWLNLIHVDDAAEAIVRLGSRSTTPTTFLLSDMQPVRRGDFYAYFAEQVGAPPPVFSGGDDELNKRCDSSTIRRYLDLELTYPSYREGLKQALTLSAHGS